MYIHSDTILILMCLPTHTDTHTLMVSHFHTHVYPPFSCRRDTWDKTLIRDPAQLRRDTGVGAIP